MSACMLNCAAADAEGNVYSRGQSMVSDAKEMAEAVKRNGGKVCLCPRAASHPCGDAPHRASHPLLRCALARCT